MPKEGNILNASFQSDTSSRSPGKIPRPKAAFDTKKEKDGNGGVKKGIQDMLGELKEEAKDDDACGGWSSKIPYTGHDVTGVHRGKGKDKEIEEQIRREREMVFRRLRLEAGQASSHTGRSSAKDTKVGGLADGKQSAKTSATGGDAAKEKQIQEQIQRERSQVLQRLRLEAAQAFPTSGSSSKGKKTAKTTNPVPSEEKQVRTNQELPRAKPGNTAHSVPGTAQTNNNTITEIERLRRAKDELARLHSQSTTTGPRAMDGSKEVVRTGNSNSSNETMQQQLVKLQQALAKRDAQQETRSAAQAKDTETLRTQIQTLQRLLLKEKVTTSTRPEDRITPLIRQLGTSTVTQPNPAPQVAQSNQSTELINLRQKIQSLQRLLQEKEKEDLSTPSAQNDLRKLQVALREKIASASSGDTYPIQQQFGNLQRLLKEKEDELNNTSGTELVRYNTNNNLLPELQKLETALVKRFDSPLHSQLLKVQKLLERGKEESESENGKELVKYKREELVREIQNLQLALVKRGGSIDTLQPNLQTLQRLLKEKEEELGGGDGRELVRSENNELLSEIQKLEKALVRTRSDEPLHSQLRKVQKLLEGRDEESWDGTGKEMVRKRS